MEGRQIVMLMSTFCVVAANCHIEIGSRKLIRHNSKIGTGIEVYNRFIIRLCVDFFTVCKQYSLRMHRPTLITAVIKLALGIQFIIQFSSSKPSA